MHGIWKAIGSFVRRADMILLSLCIAASVYGIVVISSATNVRGSTQYVRTQILALVLGIILYVVFTLVDVDIIAERRELLLIFSAIFILLLFPFGDTRSGNRSWLAFSFLPFSIQPAEICKVTYILIMASVMNSHQNRISSIPSVMHMVVHLGLIVGLNMVLSGDAGVSLIFVFIFAGMAFSGGVSLWWFLLAAGGLAAVIPFAWTHLMATYQKKRILVLFDPTIDPSGLDERYHTVQSLRSLTGGGLTGQGLFHGNRTQADDLVAGHTDYIFSTIGEELGFVGCIAVMVILLLIIIRCIHVGVRSTDYMRRLVCFGAASALMFQLISNIGMCIGVTPVIGLTLPFISYGSSSLATIYAMLGLVSGVHARPTEESHERYIRPY